MKYSLLFTITVTCLLNSPILWALSADASGDAGTTQKLTSFSKSEVSHKAKSPSAFGVTNFKPVLRDTLFRGGAGDIRSLKKDQLVELCKAGFSHAIFSYGKSGNSKGGVNAPAAVNCTMNDGRPNTIQYHFIRFNEEGPFIDIVYDVIVNNKGPVFEHCWAGNHASGELAAKALKQFCDFSPTQTKNYWLATISNPGNGSDPATRAANYHQRSDRLLNEGIKSTICPNADWFN